MYEYSYRSSVVVVRRSAMPATVALDRGLSTVSDLYRKPKTEAEAK
jgi:hypothetical protein